MPHIDIKCYPGRTNEQKKMLAEKIAEDAAEILKTDKSCVSVAITDIERADWKKQVWDKEIAPNMDLLYKKPEYNYDDEDNNP